MLLFRGLNEVGFYLILKLGKYGYFLEVIFYSKYKRDRWIYLKVFFIEKKDCWLEEELVSYSIKGKGSW